MLRGQSARAHGASSSLFAVRRAFPRGTKASKRRASDVREWAERSRRACLWQGTPGNSAMGAGSGGFETGGLVALGRGAARHAVTVILVLRANFLPRRSGPPPSACGGSRFFVRLEKELELVEPRPGRLHRVQGALD